MTSYVAVGRKACSPARRLTAVQFAWFRTQFRLNGLLDLACKKLIIDCLAKNGHVYAPRVIGSIITCIVKLSFRFSNFRCTMLHKSLTQAHAQSRGKGPNSI